MLAGLALLVLVASPQPDAADSEIAPGPATDAKVVRLASPGLQLVRIAPDLGAFYTDHFAQRLATKQLRVVTSSEIQAVLGLERQKQLLGCSDNSTSCLAEITNALGADGLITGSLARVGDDFQVNLKVVSSGDGRTLSSHQKLVDSEKELLEELNLMAVRMRSEVLRELRPSFVAEPVAIVEPTAGQSSVRSYAKLPLIGGACLAGVGLGLFLSGQSRHEALTGSGGPPAADLDGLSNVQEYAAAGRREQTFGVALLGVGGASLVAGLGMLVFGGPDEPAALSFGSDGSSVLLGGRF